MAILSQMAQKKKINYFLKNIPQNAKILEIGSSSGWVKKYFKQHNYPHYINIDIKPPADIVGDIKKYKELKIPKESFDIIIAFEVVEHVNCFKECYELLKTEGKLFVTTPLPCMDWFLKILEFLKLNQKRTSPHNNLIYLKKAPYFKNKKIKIIAGLSQWGIFTK